jgi:hypothetical protein
MPKALSSSRGEGPLLYKDPLFGYNESSVGPAWLMAETWMVWIEPSACGWNTGSEEEAHGVA